MKLMISLLFLPMFAHSTQHLLPTRSGVTMKLNIIEANKPAAVLVLMVGGAGFPDVANAATDTSKEENYLVRARQFFVDNEMTVIIPNVPSDKGDGGYGRTGKAVEFRWSPEHLEDLSHVVKYAKQTYKKEVFIVGSSMGSLSAVAYASEGKEDVSGVVLVSSFLSRTNIPGLSRFDINKVKAPIYVVHHAQDGCGGSKRAELEGWLMGSLKVHDKVFIEGGKATGNPCGPLHYHGFEGKEKDTADVITAWVSRKLHL